jgi:AraC-like DNA-binding protein
VLHSRARINWDLRTADLAVIRRSISSFLKPFVLEATADGAYDARVCHRKLSSTELTLIEYGGAVRLDAGCMDRFHLIQIPIRGGYWFEVDGERTHVGIGQAHTIPPDMELRMEWSAGCRLLVLRTTDARLSDYDKRLRRVAMRQSKGTIFPCTDGPGASLGRTVAYLAGELMESGLLRAGTPHAQTADCLLIGALVHAISSAQPGPERDRYGLVERAQRYILGNLKEDLTVAAIVAAAGVSSPRSLFRAFRELNGVSPMAWARHHRLHGVRAELQDLHSNHQSISQIASDWGFTHFGHFCEAYRRLHGETPTDTRRRRVDSMLA